MFRRSSACTLTLTTLVLFGVSVTHAASTRIRTLNTEDGLSSHNVSTITQDATGYLWVGTDDGINRYDGVEFRLYRNEPGDTTTISDSRVTTAITRVEGDVQILYVGTRNGLNRVNLKTGISRMYLHDPDNPNSLSHPTITALSADSDGNLWVGTESGLNLLEWQAVETGIFKRVYFDSSDNPAPDKNFIRALAQGIGHGSNLNLWVGTRDGLRHLHYHDSNDYQTQTFNFSYSGRTPNENEIRALHIRESKNRILLYLGTDAGELYSLDLLNPGADPKRIMVFNHYMRDIQVDALDQLWIATYGGGLIRLREDDQGHFQRTEYLGSPDVRNSLSNSHLSDLFLDMTGVLWVGTDNGLNAVLEPAFGFNIMGHDPQNPASLVGTGIRSIFLDSRNNLWVGTVSNGLTRVDPDRRTYQHFIHEPQDASSISANSITSILEDRRGNIWLGSWDGGLMKMNPDGRTFQIFSHDPENPNSLPNNIIQGLAEDDQGNIWLNTAFGLSRFEVRNSRFVNYIPDPTDSTALSDGDLQSKAMYFDRSGNLWVGSYGGGLNRLDLTRPENHDPATAKFIHYRNDPQDKNSLSNDLVISLNGTMQGNKEIIWVGTFSGGLNRLLAVEGNDFSQVNIQRFSDLQGLCDNTVFGIELDARGMLWLSTAHGLSAFDPGSEVFTNYYTEDGLPANSFFWGASHRGHNGELFFGGTDGLVNFFPYKITPPVKTTPMISITAIGPTGSMGTERLRDYNHSVHDFQYNSGPISVHWALFDFMSPDKNQYAYKLSPLHQEYIKVGNTTRATFNHLDGGSYTLHVRGTNHNGVLTPQEAIVQLRIIPPFYRTLAFKVLLVFLVGILIYVIIVLRTRMVSHANRQLRQLNLELQTLVDEKQQAEALIRSSLEEKEVLLREIYHRTKNNMAVIISLLDLQSAGIKDDETKTMFNDVKGRIYAMSLVHEQLMRTQDLTAINLNTYISQLLKNIVQSFRGIDEKVEFETSIEPVEMSIDTAVPLGLVLNEIITNSLKYAFPDDRQGKIKIEARMGAGELVLQIADDGIGFDAEKTQLEKKSLGRNIISTIVMDQLDGKLALDTSKGTHYSIRLKDIRIVRRV